ncbi:hypothetical protein [Porphyrobacter sp. YT40]|uniref:hypothetical protein n=1 Tax=Porphyrobacter sp. YT40 TaxID=2547601 RepID=UPI001144D8D1|nr:hypothetical protein [Porphyrobacter sp. YT40]QDH34694.1 hypothetical protein E2E27_10395 [Porphyrobacter sp. YT40]
MMFVGGIGDGIAAIFILAGLGLVFIVGSLMAVFFKIIGAATGRAVLWGFGLPLAGLIVVIVSGWILKPDRSEKATPTGIPIEIERDAKADRLQEGV